MNKDIPKLPFLKILIKKMRTSVILKDIAAGVTYDIFCVRTTH